MDRHCVDVAVYFLVWEARPTEAHFYDFSLVYRPYTAPKHYMPVYRPYTAPKHYILVYRPYTAPPPEKLSPQKQSMK